MKTLIRSFRRALGVAGIVVAAVAGSAQTPEGFVTRLPSAEQQATTAELRRSAIHKAQSLVDEARAAIAVSAGEIPVFHRNDAQLKQLAERASRVAVLCECLSHELRSVERELAQILDRAFKSHQAAGPSAPPRPNLDGERLWPAPPPFTSKALEELEALLNDSGVTLRIQEYGRQGGDIRSGASNMPPRITSKRVPTPVGGEWKELGGGRMESSDVRH